jgi:hypothetical protein
MNGQGQILAELLAKRCPDIQVLHDRRMPHSKANIDHVAICGSGVYVIDTKRYRGKIEVRQPLFGAAKLKIAGRDQTKLVDGLARQVAVVEATLGGTLRDGDQGDVFNGRQHRQSPETQVSVAGHRAGKVEPKDESRSRGALKIA